jgi:hypothetical protein
MVSIPLNVEEFPDEKPDPGFGRRSSAGCLLWQKPFAREQVSIHRN